MCVDIDIRREDHKLDRQLFAAFAVFDLRLEASRGAANCFACIVLEHVPACIRA